MKKKTLQDQNRTAFKMPLITTKDAAEYEGIKAGLIARLKRMGSYEPEIDDLHIDAIARATIYLKHTETLLDSDKANEETYSRVTDAQAKLRKIVENALRELAVTRKERMAAQTGRATEEELTKAILEALRNKPK